MKKNKDKQGIVKKASRLTKKNKINDAKVSEALKDVPNITNENVVEHRESILSSARKFIYPLKHSRHSFVRRSLLIFVLVVIAFFTYCGIDLYALQSTSGFMYTVTEVVPFPVAKEGNTWISYNSYLFELRRNMHYYITQQQSNFKTTDGKTQLSNLKKQALSRVIQDAYVKNLAKKNGVSVSSSDINEAINLVKSQNKLGNSNQVLDKVLSEYWGWNQADLRRELESEILAEKVVAKLDTKANSKADNILQQLSNGGNFANLAKQYSDDTSTASNGGQYPNNISLNDSNIDPRIINAISKLSAGSYSKIINTGYALEILQLNSISNGSAKVSHIQINLQPISKFVNQYEKEHTAHIYISVKPNQ